MPTFANSCKRKLNCHRGHGFRLNLIGSKGQEEVLGTDDEIFRRKHRSASKYSPGGVEAEASGNRAVVTQGSFTVRKPVKDSSLMASWMT